MADIRLELPIEAPPERVFEAIATPGGLASWWTSQAATEPRVGSEAVFRFPGSTTVFRMKVDKLDRARKIEWSCTGEHEEWRGTRLTGKPAPYFT